MTTPGEVPVGDNTPWSELVRGPEFVQRLIDNLCDGVCITDIRGKPVAVNRALCRMTGSVTEAWLTVTPFTCWPADDSHSMLDICARVRAGDLTQTETTFVRSSGERFPVLLQPSALHDARGEIGAVLVTITDMTEQRRVQVALQESEQRWRSIVENPFDFVVIIDRDYKFQFINHPAPGLRIEDLIDKATPFDFTAPQSHAEMRLAFESAFSTGRATSFETYSPQLEAWFTTIVGPIKSDGAVTALSLLTRNTTDAKRAEQAQRRSERRLALALEGSNDGLFDWSLARATLYYSPRMYELLGFTPGDPGLSTAGDGLEQRLHPDDRAAVTRALRAAIQSGNAFSEEYRLRTYDGTYRWYHGRGRTFLEEENDARFIGFLTDITQRRELAHELQQAHRLETIGTLAGGIAHDFNNLLTPILCGIELAQLAMDETHTAQVDLMEARRAALRARDLTQQILTFARHGEFRRESVAVVEVAREALQFCASTLPAGVEVHSYFQWDCPAVLGDRTQLHQIVTNLIDNARKAMQGTGGRLTLRIESVDGAEVDATEIAEIKARSAFGPYVRIRVQDTGQGMQDSIKLRVFEPFFTTRQAGEGTGLGLSVVHGIVKRHQGRLRVHSTVGQGTTIEVYLPATDAAPDATTSREVPELAFVRTAKRVLCVDDEPSVLGTVKRALQVAGYLVSAARDANEALQLLRTSSPGFDLLITDYRMPGLSGLELAHKARLVHRNLPVILITGQAEGLPRHCGVSVNAIIGKPFLLNELLATVHDCLTDAAAGPAQAIVEQVFPGID